MTEIEKAWADFLAASDAYLDGEPYDPDNPETEAALRAAGIAYFSIKQDGDTPLWADWRLKMVDFYRVGNPGEPCHLWEAAEAAYREAFLADGPGIPPPDLDNQGTQ